MHTITRKPRLLVKMSAGAGRFKLSFGAARFNVKVEPLFESIDKGRGRSLGAAAPRWHVVTATSAADEVNAWDMAHHLAREGMGVSGVGPPDFVEPDLAQRWTVGSEPQVALAAARSCDRAEAADPRLPNGDGPYWFSDQSHSQLERARGEVGEPASRVRIAHLDTGYDPEHVTLPRFLRTDLQKNFEDEDRPDDASDRSSGPFTNLGHGAGTLSILAGAAVDGVPLGGAASLDVIPLRVADSVVQFRNGAVAKALDYVHSLSAGADTRVDVITLSIGGVASQAWAEAVNALYEQGVFIVSAAGNNFGHFPTRNIVYPARFGRVVAACGVMADGSPYADLPVRIMAGNYGPDGKMATAVSAYTPNTPWARLGCSTTVDYNGRGTSAAAPQVASAAALWIQKHRDRLSQYPEPWMRVEAVREALFRTARLSSPGLRARLGNGVIQAFTALGHAPAGAASLRKQPEDSASFPLLRVLLGLGLAADDARQRMLELEALQLTLRSHELERLLPDPSVAPEDVPEADRRRIADALAETPGASRALRESLGRRGGTRPEQVAVPQEFDTRDAARIQKALDPPTPEPVKRRLRVFAYDPLLGTRLDTLALNETTLEVRWEQELAPGPVGEYLEIVDVDPATGACYAPVDLNHPLPLSQAGLSPSEANPRFHQQMVYAVAMKTIEHFEYALGRVAQWAPRFVRTGGRAGGVDEQFVRRLRVYPHAIREENSFYSPDKKALLFGYFSASKSNPGDNLPGQTVFCCLSHDIIAHETTHALLDGLHRRFHEPTNEDVLAFHEAFADIVALFQHFTVPEALRDQIARTRGDLGRQNILGQLAQQFGQATGNYGALRDAIGGYDREKQVWQPATPSAADYQNATEPHDRGAVLVAAVFDAFLNIYRTRSEDLIRLATGGTGVLPPGALPHDLIVRLAQEAGKAASHVLNICIRALDYCPPVDINFSDYVRALVTADRDLVPDDDLGYRVAFIQAFRRRGIYPQSVRSLTSESLCWNSPDLEIPIEGALQKMSFAWDLHANRRHAYESSKTNAATLHRWISEKMSDDSALALGFYRSGKVKPEEKAGAGRLSNFEVHSVRPVRRVGPDDQQQLDLVVEITQNWRPAGREGEVYRGGTTLIIDLEKSRIRYSIRKRVANAERIDRQRSFRMALDEGSLRSNYFNDGGSSREPFALIHRGL